MHKTGIGFNPIHRTWRCVVNQKHIAGLIAVTLTLSLVGCASSASKLSPEFREAQRSLEHPEAALLANALLKEDNQEYAEARERYREIAIGYPGSIEAQLGMARIENITGRKEQAEKILTTLAKEHPNNVDVQLGLGRMYASRESWDQAIVAMTKAYNAKPDNQTARFELGLACVRANRVNEALPHLTFAVGESAAMYNIGYVLQEQGRNDEAIRWYQEALGSHPDQRTALQAQQMLTKLTKRTPAGDSRVATIRPVKPRFDGIAASDPMLPSNSPSKRIAAVEQQQQPTGASLWGTTETDTAEFSQEIVESQSVPFSASPPVLRQSSFTQPTVQPTFDQEPPAWRQHR